MGEQSHFKGTRAKGLKVDANELKQKVGVGGAAYFVQGVKTEMATTAERFLMKDNLGLSAAQVRLLCQLLLQIFVQTCFNVLEIDL
jgi:hypothetical protein